MVRCRLRGPDQPGPDSGPGPESWPRRHPRSHGVSVAHPVLPRLPLRQDGPGMTRPSGGAAGAGQPGMLA